MAITLKSFLSLRILSAVLIICAFVLGVIVGNRWIDHKPQEPGSSQTRAAAPKMTIAAGQPVVGFLDMVDGKPILSGEAGSDIRVSGWAACTDSESPLAKLDILIDKKTTATAAPTFPRPDVAAAYGRSDFEKSGWKSSLSLRGVDSGEHELSVRVTCAKGETGLVPPFRLVVTRP
jgi:hypothetical protein